MMDTPPTSVKTARHPKGLYVLFLTETWAHFSYFDMQAMLRSPSSR